MSETRTRLLGVFYIVEGLLFLAYSTWRLWIHPLEFYRAPPLLDVLAKIFMLSMFAAGIFYISRAPSIIRGFFKSRTPDIIASVLPIPLWLSPALLSIGNANTYLTWPYVPAELRATGFYYAQLAVFFIAIGIFNILSLCLSSVSSELGSSSS